MVKSGTTINHTTRFGLAGSHHHYIANIIKFKLFIVQLSSVVCIELSYCVHKLFCGGVPSN